MDPKKINWEFLKSKDYMHWRETLYKETMVLLNAMAAHKRELSEINDVGSYHKVFEPKEGEADIYQQMKDSYKAEGKVPEDWISKGNYPGIWTCLFNPNNAFSFTIKPVMHMMTFEFNDGYHVFDGMLQEHQEMWSQYEKNKASKVENSWSNMSNSGNSSLEKRLGQHHLPSHKGFYEENKFGAVAGYSDYMSLVIMLPEAVKNVTFFDIEFNIGTEK